MSELKIKGKLKGKYPPKSLQGVLWSSSVEKVDLWEHRVYIIHRVLAFGTWKEWQWLFNTYPKEVVKRVFVKDPVKEYTRPAFNFVKNILLQLKKERLPLVKYARDLPRDIRS